MVSSHRPRAIGPTARTVQSIPAGGSGVLPAAGGGGRRGKHCLAPLRGHQVPAGILGSPVRAFWATLHVDVLPWKWWAVMKSLSGVSQRPSNFSPGTGVLQPAFLTFFSVNSCQHPVQRVITPKVQTNPRHHHCYCALPVRVVSLSVCTLHPAAIPDVGHCRFFCYVRKQMLANMCLGMHSKEIPFSPPCLVAVLRAAVPEDGLVCLDNGCALLSLAVPLTCGSRIRERIAMRL